MATLWVVCGASSRVGKTHLARRLCAILPSAVYAKHGHGRRKAGLPGNFFRTERGLRGFLERAGARFRHIVVESNVMARRGEGDLILFLESARHAAAPRVDAKRLCANAHIRVTRSAKPSDWERALARHLPDRRIRAAVCAALSEQRAHVPESAMAVRSKIWFVRRGGHAFGPGLMHLLEGVERDGTLSRAARAAGMSYRHAWGEIRAAERHLRRSLVVSRAGGKRGGGTNLSAHGRHLVRVFRRVSVEVARYADARFARHYGREVAGE